MRRNRFLFAIYLSLVLFLYSCNRNKFSSSFQAISEEDKSVMTAFFANLIANDQFGYVLIGAKPVAISSHFLTEPLWNLVFSHKSCKCNSQIAWEVFEKNRSKFESKKFLLLKEQAYHGTENTDPLNRSFTFIIINKERFLQTVIDNLDLFQKILGQEVTPTSLLAKITQKKQSLFETVGCDEGLYGILLGYGRSNALAFKRYLELGKSIDRNLNGLSYSFCLRRTKPTSRFHSIEEEYLYLQNQLSYFSLHAPLSPFAFPGFRALPNAETIHLQQQYTLAHRRLLKIYCGSDVLGTIFSQLFEE